MLVNRMSCLVLGTIGLLLASSIAGAQPPATSLSQWFRADEFSDPPDSSGDLVSTWTDQALGNGAQNVSQGTASRQPTWQDVVASGQSVLRFDGADDQLRASATPGIGSTSGFVYFGVVKARSFSNGGLGDGNGTYFWDRNTSSTGNPLVGLKAVGDKYGFQKRLDSGGGLGGVTSTSDLSVSAFEIVTLRRNTASNNLEIYVNGALEQSTAIGAADALTPQPIVIGGHDSFPGTALNGEIAEVLIYSNDLSATDFNTAGKYLADKYGLRTAFNPDPAATVLFSDSFLTNGNSQNINTNLAGRQSGTLATAPYSEVTGLHGVNSTQVDHALANGTLDFFTQQGDTTVSASPDINPNTPLGASGKMVIEFDVNPEVRLGTDNGTFADFVFASDLQNAAGGAATTDGIGLRLVVDSSVGTVGDFELYDGTSGATLLETTGSFLTAGKTSTNDYFNIRFELTAPLFNGVTQTGIDLFIDDSLRHSFTTDAGFGNNFLSLYGGNAATGTAAAYAFDNLLVLETTSAIIPEPSTLLIWSLLAGLGAGYTWHRRKRVGPAGRRC